VANSRTAYMAKQQTGDATTFTPPFGCNTWQLRFITDNSAGGSITVHTVDEDGHEVEIDGSPFKKNDGDFDASGNLEVTLDSSNPSIKIEPDGYSANPWIKVKAYRTLDDTMNAGAYSTTLGIG